MSHLSSKTKPRRAATLRAGSNLNGLRNKRVKYSKTKLEMHPKEGMKVEIYASPFVRACIGIAILMVAAGLFALMAAPLASVLK